MEKVQMILVKESWDEADINILLAHANQLPESAKVKLGLVPAPAVIKAVEEPVKEPATGVAKAAQEEIAKQNLPPEKPVKKGKK